MHESTFELPLAPSLNEAYPDVIAWNGRNYYVKRVASVALRQYKEEAEQSLMVQRVRHPAWKEAIEIGYEVDAYVPSRRSDLDNRLKVLQDVLSTYLEFNDNRIVEFRAHRYIDRKRPRMVVHLYTIE